MDPPTNDDALSCSDTLASAAAAALAVAASETTPSLEEYARSNASKICLYGDMLHALRTSLTPPSSVVNGMILPCLEPATTTVCY